MAQLRLLERLNGTARRGEGRRQRIDQRVRESVVAHVWRLLNTRRGNVPIDPEFGMPDVAGAYDGSNGASTELLDRTIVDLLQRYEPRLENVQVLSHGFSARDLGVAIEIKGRVSRGSRGIAVRLRGLMLSDGRFVAAEGTSK